MCFVTYCYLYPCLIFAGKAEAYPSGTPNGVPPTYCGNTDSVKPLDNCLIEIIVKYTFARKQSLCVSIYILLCLSVFTYLCHYVLMFLQLSSLSLSISLCECVSLSLPGLTRKHQTRLERLIKDKHSSLLQTFVIYGRKQFNIVAGKLISSKS